MKACKTAGLLLAAIAAGAALGACTGRKADTMVPLGETVEVVIPEGDVAADSAIASGSVGAHAVVADAVDETN